MDKLTASENLRLARHFLKSDDYGTARDCSRRAGEALKRVHIRKNYQSMRLKIRQLDYDIAVVAHRLNPRVNQPVIGPRP